MAETSQRIVTAV